MMNYFDSVKVMFMKWTCFAWMEWKLKGKILTQSELGLKKVTIIMVLLMNQESERKILCEKAMQSMRFNYPKLQVKYEETIDSQLNIGNPCLFLLNIYFVKDF